MSIGWPAAFIQERCLNFRNLLGEHHDQYNGTCGDSFARRTAKDRCLLAGLQLSFGGHDLSSRESSSARATKAGADQESAAWPLGLRSGPILDLGPPESGHQEI